VSLVWMHYSFRPAPAAAPVALAAVA
jgi:hypothetical protein